MMNNMEHKTLNNGLEDAEIRRLDTGRNVTGWPSDALRYEPASVDWPSAVNYFVLT